MKRPHWETLVGEASELDYLSTLYGGAFQSTHPMQEAVEEAIKSLTDQEKECFYLRYGEQLSIRDTSRRLYGYLNIKGIQDLLESIEKKVKECLENSSF